MKVLIARQYLVRIKEDGRNSKIAKLKNGKLPWGAPYGYKNVKDENKNSTVVFSGAEAHIVKEIFRRYANGTYSVQSLTKEINDDFGTNFYKNRIHKILTNKFYIGIIVDKETGDEHPHVYDTLISKQTFDIVQDVLNGHSTNRRRYDGVKATYGALMTRSECGCSLTPDPKKKVQKNGNVHHYLYYHCTNGKKKHTSPVHSISETKLDTIIQDLLKQLKPPEERMSALKEELMAKHKEKNALFDKKRASIKTSLDSLRRRQRTAFDKLMDGSITQEDYDFYTEQYTEESTKLAEEQKQLDNIDQSYYVTVSYLLNLFEHVADIFKVAKVNEKRQILGLLLSNLEFDGKSVHYTLKEPWGRLFLTSNRSVVAGPAGFEPAHAGTKTQCLTAWRRSNTSIISHFHIFGKIIYYLLRLS